MIISVHFLRLPSSLRPQCGSPPDWLQSGPTGIKVIFSSEPDNVSPCNMTFFLGAIIFHLLQRALGFCILQILSPHGQNQHNDGEDIRKHQYKL